jgi:hypothetical protein
MKVRDRAPRLATVLALAFMLGLGLVTHLRLHPLSAPEAPLIAPNNTAVITQTPATRVPLSSLPSAVCAARAKQGAVATKEDFIALLDTASAAYRRAARPFRFIEVGANDGVAFSDRVMSYVDRYAWTGVLLEPVPGHFRALRKAYAKLVAKVTVPCLHPSCTAAHVTAPASSCRARTQHRHSAVYSPARRRPSSHPLSACIAESDVHGSRAGSWCSSTTPYRTTANPWSFTPPGRRSYWGAGHRACSPQTKRTYRSTWTCICPSCL